MRSPPASRDGSAPRRGTLTENRRHADHMTRLGSCARLIPDQRIAPVRPRTRQSDDWLERVAARRLLNRPRASPANPLDEHHGRVASGR